jgi:hypothetical protein
MKSLEEQVAIFLDQCRHSAENHPDIFYKSEKLDKHGDVVIESAETEQDQNKFGICKICGYKTDIPLAK